MTDEMENKYVKYLEMQYNPIVFSTRALFRMRRYADGGGGGGGGGGRGVYSDDDLIFGQYFGQTEHINTAVVPLTRGDVFTGALLLASNNLNSIRDKWSHTQLSDGWNYLSISKHQRLHPWSLGMDEQLIQSRASLIIHGRVEI